jgi:8-oxo-dGTP diphosphatase
LRQEADVGDGNGWVRCSMGHRHWGRFGAAGLLITDGDRVLLQHRAAWTHEGDTWAVPGGARDSHEDPITAALREAVEETSLVPAAITPFDQLVDEHGGWSYTTILARTDENLRVAPANAESTAIRWWAIAEVAGLRLHHGFAAAWPALCELVSRRHGRPRLLP